MNARASFGPPWTRTAPAYTCASPRSPILPATRVAAIISANGGDALRAAAG
jgi:hypothetical protein